ncbi:YhgE/Pip family protein [Lacticaseibacillus daqingensis]|uniref:YhgE/Pip family protein n=1 Tax=Lacticaseibacillus daqingensis TaxID=2486014 RepID=UPI0013DDF397|nr:YhgE/Pip family protein [Lacticaseibacillus daqingensis]
MLAGGQKLSTADNQLTAGITTISKGNQQLSTRLANGTKQLPKLHFTSATAHTIASPTKVTDHNRDSVPNNGTAMMPYMAGVALYVSGMVLNMLLDTVTPRKKPKRVVDWWASKAVMINGTAIAAATVELLTLIGIAGLRPTNIFSTWITLSLANLAMTNMTTWLNLSIGKLGSLVAMILLPFQLGSAGGTYPIELSNAFFEAIHPFLPMSYVVDGFAIL